MQKKIGIIGGDLRLIFLSILLAKEKNIVYTYAQETAEILKNEKNINFCENMAELIKESELIIGPIPFSKNNIEINSAYSNKKVMIQDLMSNLKNRELIAGSINPKIYEQANENNVKIIDIMKNEKLTILNTIATAEGAIKELIANTDIIIHGAKILILGYGRVAKTLAQKLKGIDAKVTIAARKEEALAWGYTYGFNVVNINSIEEKLANYDIIVNTVPELILGKQQIKNIKSKTYLLDISSAPGGIDFEEANKNNIKAELALGLPGKYAPYTTAKFIKEVIEELCK